MHLLLSQALAELDFVTNAASATIGILCCGRKVLLAITLLEDMRLGRLCLLLEHVQYSCLHILIFGDGLG